MGDVLTRGRSESGIRLALLAATLLLLGAVAAPAGAAQGSLHGKVTSGDRGVGGTPVKVYRAGGASRDTTLLGRGVTRSGGRFRLSYRRPGSRNAVLYVTVGRGAGVRLAATLGAPPAAPSKIVVNERTTAATGFAFAQFVQGRRILGPRPGPQNAALMAANLADPRTGKVARALRRSPNGNETTTLPTFNSVANMLPRCARSLNRCTRLFRLARSHDGRRPRGALQAVANIAKNPWQNVNRLFKLARSKPAPYGNALGPDQRPAAWTMPVRFVGDGKSLDGPGNTAFDAKGNAYVANNYVYGADPLVPRCASDQLPKFKPDGSYAKNSPFSGGGLSGAGYGITLDPDGNVWVGNYGFAAPPPGCPAKRQPSHKSVSELTPHGRALSGDDGYVAGDIFWPQGTVSDQQGTIWIANCGNGKVTRMPGDDPYSAVGLDVGLEEAFDVAVNHNGKVFATGLGNSKLAILNPDGTPTAASPLGTAALGIDRPMGIAADSRGNMWIANSGLIELPCPGPIDIDLSNRGGSVSLLAKGGRPVTSGGHVFTGGGMTIPWGIAVDGDDNVWVSNFAEQRVSEICGVREWKCPTGAKTGDPISPDGRGYFFDGFVRLTSVQIDPSGNVWVTNNWKLIPVQTNPGGYEMVVMVGAAAPLKTPLIGPPVPLLG